MLRSVDLLLGRERPVYFESDFQSSLQKLRCVM